MHFYEKKLPTFTNKLKQNILWKFKHNIDKIENTKEFKRSEGNKILVTEHVGVFNDAQEYTRLYEQENSLIKCNNNKNWEIYPIMPHWDYC